ncbi:hypothetical protein COU18_01530 [Candidatus Kaiserbacteria bacterium CG10_big_fil_rev_8_21_14_0_10_51_14]|uniref:Uncharacterized protein n=1 Tax=Candidatus Kaiserbacteria bacterium CG10_big_fil_rev_8_21_14_0_10_51_14 TaxID=1974610 RepID=A0A2H0UCC2_9BACT|nr:MAG: hypothetical protein COU18_01530 [Candidatus Kaiserbacteria bacterium CG10_big_fil_rev_8_21_14_0_10_51_14]
MSYFSFTHYSLEILEQADRRGSAAAVIGESLLLALAPHVLDEIEHLLARSTGGKRDRLVTTIEDDEPRSPTEGHQPDLIGHDRLVRDQVVGFDQYPGHDAVRLVDYLHVALLAVFQI